MDKAALKLGKKGFSTISELSELLCSGSELWGLRCLDLSIELGFLKCPLMI